MSDHVLAEQSRWQPQRVAGIVRSRIHIDRSRRWRIHYGNLRRGLLRLLRKSLGIRSVLLRIGQSSGITLGLRSSRGGRGLLLGCGGVMLYLGDSRRGLGLVLLLLALDRANLGVLVFVHGLGDHAGHDG